MLINNTIADEVKLDLPILNLIIYVALLSTCDTSTDVKDNDNLVRLHWSSKDPRTDSFKASHRLLQWYICSPSLVQEFRESVIGQSEKDDSEDTYYFRFLSFLQNRLLREREYHALSITSPVPSEVLSSMLHSNTGPMDSDTAVSEVAVAFRGKKELGMKTSSVWLKLHLGQISENNFDSSSQLLEISKSFLEKTFPQVDFEMASAILTTELNRLFSVSSRQIKAIGNKVIHLQNMKVLSTDLEVLVEVIYSLNRTIIVYLIKTKIFFDLYFYMM